MTDQSSTITPAPATRSTELTVWWITFSVITLCILAMLSLWN